MKKNYLLLLYFISVFLNAQVPQTYVTFQKDTLNLYKYEGTKTMILANTNNLDLNIMAKWTTAMDGTYDFYKFCTGRDPNFSTNITYINNRSTIARVESTCGAGCGYLGATGIEIANTYFDDFYKQLKNNNQYDQLPFYEFGRNFWFYGSKLAYKDNDPVTTGYAVFMRFMAMDNLGIQGANFLSWTFPDFKNDVKKLRISYMADPNLNWGNTLGVYQGVPDSSLMATDLFASFCWYLKDTYGDCWLQNVWKYSGLRPDSITTQDAVDNFIIASSLAAKTNLTSLFQSWKWPISTDAVTYLNSYDFNVYPSSKTASCIPLKIENPNNGYDIGLRNVILANLNFSSRGYSGDNYQFYVDHTQTNGSCPQYPLKANLVKGNSYTISVTTAGNKENVRGWIDYNNNGIFESEELIMSSNGTISDETHKANFTVPTTAISSVSLRMRLSSDFYGASFPEPCSNPTYGQVEDFTIMISDNLGIKNIDNISFSIYPNPVQDKLTIQLMKNETIDKMTIIDLSGKVIITQNKNVNILDVEKLPKGIYVLEVYAGGKKNTSKILKQ
jgi:hypothetical protein